MIFYSLTMSKLEPESSNRSYSFKIICFIVWIAGSLISSFTDDLCQVWCILVTIALCFISLALLIDPDDYSSRVIKEIPQSNIVRLFKFPFFTGMANSICWIILMALLNVVFASFIKETGYRRGMFDAVIGITSVQLYVNAFFLFANFIRKIIMPDKSKTTCIGIFIGIFVFCTVMPLFFRSYRGEGILNFMSPFYAFLQYGDKYVGALIMGAGIWLIGIVLNASSIFKQIGTYFEGPVSTAKVHRPIYKDNFDLEQSK